MIALGRVIAVLPRSLVEPAPAGLPAHHQVCLRHGIWLPAPGTPQFSVSRCPDILAAERQARRLSRRCTIEQLIYSRLNCCRFPAKALLHEQSSLTQTSPGTRHSPANGQLLPGHVSPEIPQPRSESRTEHEILDGVRTGIAHHLGWAVAVTASAGHVVVERRRIELIEPGMPTAPIEHEAKPLDDDAAARMVARHPW
jgi:hypothetical protein